jgi:hypothetical protein
VAATADPLFTAALAGLLTMAGLLLATLTRWAVRAIRRRSAKPISTR